MMETPAKRMISESLAVFCVKDALGREITFRQLTPLDRLRLFKAVGPELAQNAPYLGVAMLAASVVAIDQVPLPAPASERQVESSVNWLGEEGLAAASEGLAKQTTSVPEVTLAGNSAGTPI